MAGGKINKCNKRIAAIFRFVKLQLKWFRLEIILETIQLSKIDISCGVDI